MFASLDNLPNFILSKTSLITKKTVFKPNQTIFEKTLADRQTLGHKTAPKVRSSTFSLNENR